MFQNLFRHWVRLSLEEILRQKAAQTGAAVSLSSDSGQLAGSENKTPSSPGPSGCEPSEAGSTSSGCQQTAIPPTASGQIRPTGAKSEKLIHPSEVGVVFALESESGGLEDLLQEAGQWKGDGFSVTGGRLEGRQVVIVRSGAGPASAAHATQALLDGHRPRWVISAGFAGALQPELQRYDLLLPEAVIQPTGQRLELSPPAHWSTQSAFGPIHRGLLLSVDHLVSTPKEKHILAEKYGAWAVDMETFAVVNVCKHHGTPVFAVRIIIDKLEEHLPPEVRGLLKQRTAAARLGAAFGALWHRPSSWKDLYRLKEQALVASDRLARFLAWAIAELREPPLT